jgi:hypothetical protein
LRADNKAWLDKESLPCAGPNLHGKACCHAPRHPHGKDPRGHLPILCRAPRITAVQPVFVVRLPYVVLLAFAVRIHMTAHGKGLSRHNPDAEYVIFQIKPKNKFKKY